MRFPGLFSVLGLLALTAATDFQTVRNDIANISALLKGLDASAKGIQPGSLGIARSLQLEVDSVRVHQLLLSTMRDTQAAPPFADHSIDVGGDFLNMQPVIEGVLSTLAGLKGNLGQLRLVVLACLYQLRQDADALGREVAGKLSADFQDVTKQVLGQIDDSFNQAIAAYGGKSK
ncbi:Cell wall galactomannoprotein [Cordyceps fumosorosea ARSEF 2679]|uniref:Cell wall galactomannoprotein n=1 Tax=Cordyceps fumosorosea (strain ARSEF 2679) TaxID=1081104 RepID=A0A167QP39_CORFA|nr:Cell wall galactomannoprotein [Cordyceps fumosorosea ARSEF 2679]OAA57817.1 Cell wall galactomannoprotein [Cordyceps fumosorosea ARSEF 2679]